MGQGNTFNTCSSSKNDGDKEMLEQSPIVLKRKLSNNTLLMNMNDKKNSELKISYPRFLCESRIINKGSTVEIQISNKYNCCIFIKNEEFKLKQFHFHCPSEHVIDGEVLDMEMHLVHINEKNEIAVFGFLFSTNKKYQEKDETPKNDDDDNNNDEKNDKFMDNEFLNQFMDEIPSKKTDTKGNLLKNNISFDYLFNNKNDKNENDDSADADPDSMIDIDMNIWEYKGSLTTPPYTENVNWFVDKKIHYITKHYCNLLKMAWNNNNNARKCQPYNGRIVNVRKGLKFQ